MNMSASAIFLWGLKKSLHQRPCLSQLVRFQYGMIAAPTRFLCVSHCQNTYLNQRTLVEKESLWKKAKDKIRYFFVERSKIKRCGYYLYESIADKINYLQFFEDMNLPDTFNSWFLVTELHVWMLMIRCTELGTDGQKISYNIVESMWEDVQTKCKKLGPEHSSKALKQIRELGDQFYAAILGYDEGILANDKVLASALWRRFFGMNCDDPKKLETMVGYVRQQMHYLDTLTEEQIGKIAINWPPLEKIN